MTGAAKEDGALEQFIAAFNAYEAEEDLFERCVDAQGRQWWDMARYNVQMAIASERRYFGSAHRSQFPAHYVRAWRFLLHLLRLVLWCVQLMLLRFKKLNTLYLSSRVIDGIAQALPLKGRKILYVNNSNKAPKGHAALSKHSIDFLLRVLTGLITVPSDVQKQAVLISDQVKQRFDTSVDVQSILLAKYKEMRVGYWVWQFVLKQMPHLKQVFFVNDDMYRPLVVLARGRGIETIETQHGYMGRGHFSYCYPEIKNMPLSLPDAVWVVRDTGDIVHPVPKVMIDRPKPEISNVPRDIDILIGSQPGMNDETLQIAQILSQEGREVVVKLHPTQSVSFFEQDLKKRGVNCRVYGVDEKFMSLAQRAKVYVPVIASSTTAFEAIEAGAKLVIVHTEGFKVTSMCNDIALAEAYDMESLKQQVQACLQQKAEV